MLTSEMPDELGTIFEGVCRDFEAEWVEMGGGADQVHLLVHCPPKVAVSRLVQLEGCLQPR